MNNSIVLKFTIAGHILVRNSYPEFHESPTNALVIDTRSQECGRKWSSLKVSVHCVKNSRIWEKRRCF